MENEIKLRDYFAAKALEGIHANNDMWANMCMDRKNFTRDKGNDTHEDYVAQQCYKMADAMLKERKQGQNLPISDVSGSVAETPVFDEIDLWIWKI
jgi:hypothetical protein